MTKQHPPLRCFVAMAIRDRADTEHLHFRVIKPTLKKLGIRAYRIDEIHHSENIDNRLLAEIRRADVVLVDLTYERPSVYFEAGYALARDIPLVFTCRADHLSRGSPHEVHFDLRQRNILPWKTETERLFPAALLKRVRAVVAPVVRAGTAAAIGRAEEAAFAHLSPKERLTRMIRRAARLALRSGWRPLDPGPGYTGVSWRGYVGKSRQAHTLRFLAVRDAQQRLLRTIRDSGYGLSYLVQQRLQNQVSMHIDRFVVLSLRAVGPGKVEKGFPDFRSTGRRTWAAREREEDNIPRDHRMFLHVLDNVRSERDLEQRLGPLLQEIRITGRRIRVRKEVR